LDSHCKPARKGLSLLTDTGLVRPPQKSGARPVDSFMNGTFLAPHLLRSQGMTMQSNAAAQRQAVVIQSSGDTLAGVLFRPEGYGQAPALIVCHGAGEFKEHYFEICEFLAANGVAALALDMHGHGESGGARFHVSMREWVEDVRQAVDFLSKHDAVDSRWIGGFGLSSGGTAILEAAVVEPRLKFLVGLDATVCNSMPLPLTWILQVMTLAGRLKKKLTGTELRLSLSCMFAVMKIASDPEINRELKANPKSREAFLAFPFPGAEDSFFVNTIERVPAIKAPTMVIWGEDDELDPPKTARSLFAALTCKKELHIVPGNGHVGHLDRNRQKVFELTLNWVLENSKGESAGVLAGAGSQQKVGP
jgi:alpha-beta hydrolase superfamily lysophospholipase